MRVPGIPRRPERSGAGVPPGELPGEAARSFFSAASLPCGSSWASYTAEAARLPPRTVLYQFGWRAAGVVPRPASHEFTVCVRSGGPSASPSRARVRRNFWSRRLLPAGLPRPCLCSNVSRQLDDRRTRMFAHLARVRTRACSIRCTARSFVIGLPPWGLVFCTGRSHFLLHAMSTVRWAQSPRRGQFGWSI